MPILALDVMASPESLHRIRELICRTSEGLSDTARIDLLLAVGEAAANAVRHGSPHGPHDRVLIVWRRSASSITVTIYDNGRPFCPPLVPPPGDHASGRGVFIMRRCVDRVRFLRCAAGNAVVLEKHV